MRVSEEYKKSILWWAIPKTLAGSRAPYISVERSLPDKQGLIDHEDDLPVLYELGIRSIVGLLKRPFDRTIYERAGFTFLCLPIQYGEPPTIAQVLEFIFFFHENQEKGNPVVVHCEGGIGRTGTLITAYLISQGMEWLEAVEKVRSIQPLAIETTDQLHFLENFEKVARNI